MTCSEHIPRELLPAYQENSLDRNTMQRVESHISSCETCSAELDLLRLLAGEPVPDPGEVFWASLPDRVHQEVRAHGRARAAARQSWSPAALLRSLWIRAAVAAAIVALVSWIILRPAPRTMPMDNTQIDMVSAVELFDMPSSMSELEISETTRLAAWMDQQSVQLQEAVYHLSAGGNGLDRSLDEDLSMLDHNEMNRLATALSKEQEAGT